MCRRAWTVVESCGGGDRPDDVVGVADAEALTALVEEHGRVVFGAWPVGLQKARRRLAA